MKKVMLVGGGKIGIAITELIPQPHVPTAHEA